MTKMHCDVFGEHQRNLRKDTLVHRADARLKTGFSILLIIIVSFSKTQYPLYFIVPTIILLMVIARVPAQLFLKRMIICFPFLLYLFLIPRELAVMMLSKALTSIAIIVLLSVTTEFKDVLSSLKSFGVPVVFVMMLSFFWKNLFIFSNNLRKMRIAMNSRHFGRAKVENISVMANVIASIFVRSFEQSERAYMAMLARGYDEN